MVEKCFEFQLPLNSKTLTDLIAICCGGQMPCSFFVLFSANDMILYVYQFCCMVESSHNCTVTMNIVFPDQRQCPRSRRCVLWLFLRSTTGRHVFALKNFQKTFITDIPTLQFTVLNCRFGMFCNFAAYYCQICCSQFFWRHQVCKVVVQFGMT